LFISNHKTVNNIYQRQTDRRLMPFLPQPSHFILAWDRHQICWLTYPVAWLYIYIYIYIYITDSSQKLLMVY